MSKIGLFRYPELSGLTEKIIGAAIEVHRHLGPGLLESTYETCIAYEFEAAGIHFERQKEMRLTYKSITLDKAYRLDFVVAGQVIVELKAVEKLLPVHEAQVLSYLTLSGSKVGLLFNFHSKRLKEGLKRLVI